MDFFGATYRINLLHSFDLLLRDLTYCLLLHKHAAQTKSPAVAKITDRSGCQ